MIYRRINADGDLFADQVNVCAATRVNPMARVGDAILNETFSSLSAANPSATTFSVDAAALASQAAATRSAASETSASASATATAIPKDVSKSVSGGTIAGAVVGGLAAIAAIIGLVWFVSRRRRGSKTSLSEEHTSKGERSEIGGPAYTQVGAPAPQYQTAEVEGSQGWHEMAGEGNGLLSGVKEMPDTSTRAGARELPG